MPDDTTLSTAAAATTTTATETTATETTVTTSREASAPAASVGVISQAAPASTTAGETRVIIHTETVSLLRRLIDDAERGLEGAASEAASVFRHVFEHVA